MHLTRFRINTARLGARSLLASPQRLHAAVMSSFAGALPSDTDRPRPLWRLDRNAKAEVLLYIVSEERPDLTNLVEQAGWPTTAAWETYEYGTFLAGLRTGDAWAFRLTANPVHHIRRKEGEPTKRTAHVGPRHQMGWLLARQEAAGFRILTTPPSNGGYRRATSTSSRYAMNTGTASRRPTPWEAGPTASLSSPSPSMAAWR